MFELQKPGYFFKKACRLSGAARPNPVKVERLRADIARSQSDIRRLEDVLKTARLAKADSREMSRVSAELSGKNKRLASLTKVRDQKDFRRAMRITGMGLRVEEVVRFSGAMAVLAMIMALLAAGMAAAWLDLEPIMTLAACAACGIAVPLTVFIALVGYPERLAKSLELEAFGSAPEIVNYMVMSMELSPSIDKALEFAACNAEGPMADELKSLIWNVKSRKCATTEEALMAYAKELEGMNEDLRSAIFSILSVSKEQDRMKARAGLRRAGGTVLTGTRQRVEGFAASLGTPATVLFSLGILLPMIIGSMLPMISMGGFDMAQQPAVAVSEGWHRILFFSILLMNVAFPLTAFAYARSILSKRPGIHTAPEASEKTEANGMAVSLVIMAIFFCAALGIGTLMHFWDIQWSVAALVALFGLSAGLWYALAPHVPQIGAKKLLRLEEQMPDMLFQLGSRLGEGVALEKALEDAAETMAGTEMGGYLGSIIARMRRSGQGLEDVLFSPSNGMMTHHPSRKLRAAMRLTVEAARKDAETAGSILITMSNHSRDLANSDREVRLKLRSTIDSMKNTAILFAPVIMGVTVGLYALLSRTFAEMNGSVPMPAPYFIMIIGIYLLLTVGTIMYFCSGIEHGRGRWKRDTAIALPVAAIIFCVTSIGALMAFG